MTINFKWELKKKKLGIIKKNGNKQTGINKIKGNTWE